MIENEFWNFCRFVPATDSANKSTGFYDYDEYKLGVLIANYGDKWRFLMPKSDLQQNPIKDIDVFLCKQEYISIQDNKAVIDFSKNPSKVGILRNQNCENYSEIKIAINSIPDGENYKQFAILRQNGNLVLPTFKEQITDKNLYIKALKKHFEEYFGAVVFVDVDGNIMTIRIYNNAYFYLSNEICSIGLGTTNVLNSNNPSISVNKIGTISLPSQYSYTLSVKNIAVGNILTLDDTTVIVKVGDTEESIKNTLLKGSETFIVDQSATFAKNSSLGTYKVYNSIKPLVTKSLISSTGGNDNYRISITEQFEEGNIIQITSNGVTPITVNVTESMSKSDIEDLLNPDGGYYSTPMGNAVSLSSIEGFKTVNNNNELVFEFSNTENIPSKTVDRYSLYINDDVIIRNEFTLNDNFYVAKDGDSPNDIAKSLGYSNRAFTVDVPTGETLTAFAGKGMRYGVENIADIGIIKQPIVKIPSQCICEISFPETKGRFLLALNNRLTGECISISNYIDIGTMQQSKNIEYADIGTVYNHEYYENGLTQNIRVPMCITHPLREIEENRSIRIDGGFVRNETNIREYVKYTTSLLNNQISRAFQVALRNKYLNIDNSPYYSQGEISDDYVDEYHDYIQCSGKLYRQGKISNVSKTLNISNLSQKLCKVLVDFAKTGLRIVLSSNTFDMLLTDRLFIKSGEYDVIIDNQTSDITGLDIYENDVLKRKVLLDKNSRFRLHDFVRFDESVKFKHFSLNSSFEVEEWINQEDGSVIVIEYQPEFNIISGNEFNQDFNQDFSVQE